MKGAQPRASAEEEDRRGGLVPLVPPLLHQDTLDCPQTTLCSPTYVHIHKPTRPAALPSSPASSLLPPTSTLPPPRRTHYEHRRACTLSLSKVPVSPADPDAPSQETLFGRTKTPAERLRQHQRALQKAQRELDRERSKLEQQEKKLILDIKNSARKGEIVSRPLSPPPAESRPRVRESLARGCSSPWAIPSVAGYTAKLPLTPPSPSPRRAQGPCKVMAKDLVRTRRYVSKFYTMKTQLQGVSLRIQGMRSNQQMAEAMKGATKVRSRLGTVPRVDAGVFAQGEPSCAVLLVHSPDVPDDSADSRPLSHPPTGDEPHVAAAQPPADPAHPPGL